MTQPLSMPFLRNIQTHILMDSEHLFTKGFNSGYLMAQFEPSLLNKLVIKNMAPTVPFLEGLLAGREEYELTQNKTQLDELRDIRDRSSSQDQELGRDIK
jgi:hypothetical protein